MPLTAPVFLQHGHLQQGGAGFDPVQAYHEAREQGRDLYGSAKSEARQAQHSLTDKGQRAKSEARGVQQDLAEKGQRAKDRLEEQGRHVVQSVQDKGREALHRSKEGWSDLKDSFKSAGKISSLPL